MKITKIDVMMLKPDRGIDDNTDTFMNWSKPEWRPVVCRIYTDEEVYGDGEAAVAYGNAAPGAFGMLQELSRLIIGMDPMKNELIWETLYKRTFWGQNSGPIFYSALSAIDMACWDIRGKSLNVPLHVLLGGKRRDNLRAYASQLQFGWAPQIVPAVTTKDYVNSALKAVDEGYDAVKIDFFTFDEEGNSFSEEERNGMLLPKHIDLIVGRVAAVREAIGPYVDIIMENHSFLDAQSAIRLGKRVEQYDIALYEEPNTPTPRTTKYISDRLSIPLASGERIFTRWQYAPYFEDQSLQVAQPDVGTCGGITELKKICDMAHIYDISVQVHVCASPLSTAAALHVESVIPNFAIHENHIFNLQKFNRDLCIHDYQPKDGKYTVPNLPGIGNEFSEFALNNCDKVIIQ